MSSNLDRLTKLFAERTNPTIINVTIGEVIGTNPLRIKYGDSIILEQKHLYISDSLYNGYIAEYTDDDGESIITKDIFIKNELHNGDKVMMIPDNHFKNWYIIDKVVKL